MNHGLLIGLGFLALVCLLIYLFAPEKIIKPIDNNEEVEIPITKIIEEKSQSYTEIQVIDILCKYERASGKIPDSTIIEDWFINSIKPFDI